MSDIVLYQCIPFILNYTQVTTKLRRNEAGVRLVHTCGHLQSATNNIQMPSSQTIKYPHVIPCLQEKNETSG